MISHDHRCIFVHIPKTAGNSINRVFGVGWENHKDLQRYYDEVPRDVFSGYFKFAIVRNPWDRLLSDYNYQVKKSRARNSKLFVFAADGSKRNFAEWVETALSAPDRYDAGDWGGSVSAHIHRWSPQIDWLTVAGESRIDFVARLERLPEDFRIVCHEVGLPPVRLPHRNRRLHWHYSHYYDRATREIVATYYARDIRKFDYEFEQAFLRLAFNWPGARPAGAAETAVEESPVDDARSSERVIDVARGVGRPVFSGTVRPPAGRRIWRRPGFAALACLAYVLGMFRVSSPAALTLTEAGVLPAPVQWAIMRSGAASGQRANENLLAKARRLNRTMSELNLSLEFLPASAPGGIFTVASTPFDVPQNPLPAAAPVISRSGSGPAPRWWLRRNRNNPDD